MDTWDLDLRAPTFCLKTDVKSPSLTVKRWHPHWKVLVPIFMMMLWENVDNKSLQVTNFMEKNTFPETNSQSP